MKTLLFKTNLSCGSCLRSVTPFLDEREGIRNWKVDLNHDDRILTVEADDDLTPTEVRAAVGEAGFTAVEVD